MGLDDEQLAHYRKHGWVAPVDVMSEAEAGDLLSMLEQAEAEHPEDLHPECRNNAHLAFPFLADVVIDPRIVDCAESIVGPDIWLWSTVLFVKEPSSAGYVSWHQDAYYMGLEPDRFVTAWLALSPSTLESGCVSVIPASHRTPSPHVDRYGDDNILTRGQEVDGVDAATAVHLELRPGQMSLHHPWIIHGSQPNRSSVRRVGLAMQSYLAGEVRPVRGEHQVVSIRGADPDAAFATVPLPTELDDTARAVRAAANAALSSVLYDGADEVRRF
jgi:ectoine hydroxylase-related dioxygenase (phytanoyl-CoA dioxygenase family)